MIGTIRDFLTYAFDYYVNLENISIDRSVNRYLLEYIANGFVKYGNSDKFIENIDEWLRKVSKIFKEIGFDHNNHQITATIDLIDQVVVIDDLLMDELEYIIQVQKKYGLIVKYKYGNETITTTLSKFFETIQRSYPQIKDRYKGLGSSDPAVMAEVVMNPKTRRIYRVTIDDIERTKERMAVLIGKDRDCVKQRKEMLLGFKFTAADIDT